MARSNNNEPDAFIEMMRFITKLAVGGHSLIYTGAGVLVLMVYAFSQYVRDDVPLVVPIIGAGMCLTGLFFFLMARNKNLDR